MAARGWVLAVAASALTATAAGAGLLAGARETAVRSGLDQATCPGDGTELPAWFLHEPGGGRRSAEAGAILPMAAAEATAFLDDVTAWPSWLFVDEQGAPGLREVRLDPSSGRAKVTVGDAVLSGRLRREADAGGLALRVDMLGGKHVRDLGLEVAVLPLAGCPQACVGVVRCDWKVSLGARVFAGQAASLPAMVVLALRDDLVAHAMDLGGLWGLALGLELEEGAEGLVVAGAPPGQEGAEGALPPGSRLLRSEPGLIRTVPPGRVDPLRALAGREKVSLDEYLEAFWRAQSGRQSIVGHAVTVAGQGEPRVVHLPKPDGQTLAYGIRLSSGSLSFSSSVTEEAR